MIFGTGEILFPAITSRWAQRHNGVVYERVRQEPVLTPVALYTMTVKD